MPALLRRQLKRQLTRLDIKGFVNDALQCLREIRRRLRWHRARGFGRADQQLIRRYLDRERSPKLQIGSGANQLQGWLNSDYYPARRSVLHLDATGRFPLPDETFDWVFSEHMIEHVSYPEGMSMLAECFRVMRPGGRIRVATPDVQFLIDLYRGDHDDLQREYTRWIIEWLNERQPGAAPFGASLFVINNFVRDWGHQFIYDEATLRFSLERAGFHDVRRCAMLESADPVLRGLERADRMPAGFLQLETLVLEAERPA